MLKIRASNLLITSILIPIGFVIFILTLRLLEAYFRMSDDYRFLYSYGSPLIWLLILGLLIYSFLHGYLIIKKRGEIKNMIWYYISLLLTMSPVMFVVITMIIISLK